MSAAAAGTDYYAPGSTDVAVADGGTGLSSGTSGGVLAYTAAGTLASSAALTSNGVVLGGGAGAVPKVAAGLSSDGTSQLRVGVGGTSVGSIRFENATSGTLTVNPPTGALGTLTMVWPNANSTLPIFSQQVTFAGPTAARTYTLPDAAVTLAQLGSNAFTAAQRVTPSALTDGATINVDASLSNNFKVTLAGNRTLANPTNLGDGQVLNFKVKQDATGTRTLAYGTNYKWTGGTAPVLSTAANAVDVITCWYDSTDTILMCSITKDVR
jgi:hypothetical protein